MVQIYGKTSLFLHSIVMIVGALHLVPRPPPWRSDKRLPISASLLSFRFIQPTSITTYGQITVLYSIFRKNTNKTRTTKGKGARPTVYSLPPSPITSWIQISFLKITMYHYLLEICSVACLSNHNCALTLVTMCPLRSRCWSPGAARRTRFSITRCQYAMF